MPNVKNTIDSANKRKLEKEPEHNHKENPTMEHRKCNCRDRKECPLQNQCLEKNIIYQATVKTQKEENTYVGVTETPFKTRYGNHKQSINNPKYKSQTELSKHIWTLKDQNTEFSITWKILRHATPYNSSTKRCNLCTTEKYIILCKQELATLNTKAELVSNCRHKNKFLTKLNPDLQKHTQQQAETPTKEIT